ncbi:MAG: FHA domain-containing protein [Bellilinea sp.]
MESPGVSRRHARLIQQDQGYLLEDLGSSNGTFVNGERISTGVQLKNGDEVRLGQAVKVQALRFARDVLKVNSVRTFHSTKCRSLPSTANSVTCQHRSTSQWRRKSLRQVVRRVLK